MYAFLWGRVCCLGALVALGASGCGTVGGDLPVEPPPPQKLTYCNNAEAAPPSCDIPDFDIRKTLAGCAGDPATGGCHSGAAPQFGFEIDPTVPGTSPADWVRKYTSVPGTVCASDLIINPTDPDCSFMLTKVTDKPKCGSRMPNIVENHLSPPEMDCFRKWMHDAFGSSSTCASFGGDDDGDEVCGDADACPGFNDTIDTDMDGSADGCDLCAGNDTTGDSDADGVCDDTDVCTGDDATGDTDDDKVCDDSDVCPGSDDADDSDGDGVPDGCDMCTGNDASGDTDDDSICDDSDECPGFDDTVDMNMNGIPDGCDI